MMTNLDWIPGRNGHPDYKKIMVWEGAGSYMIRGNPLYILKGIQDILGLKHPVVIIGIVKTIPAERNDLFWIVHEDDIPNAITNCIDGMHWFEDIYGRHHQGIYPREFRDAYPDTLARGG